MEVEIDFEDGRAKCQVAEVTQTPTEGKLFYVNSLGIDRKDFQNPKRDPMQERTRQIIQEAFAEVDKHPEKYAAPFYTLIPEKNWIAYKTPSELNEYANYLGGVMANWVEQALEWAQRIFNGESWETICNNADTAKWYRMIRWKNGYYWIIGGSRDGNIHFPASGVLFDDYYYYLLLDTVPLVVIRK